MQISVPRQVAIHECAYEVIIIDGILVTYWFVFMMQLLNS